MSEPLDLAAARRCATSCADDPETEAEDFLADVTLSLLAEVERLRAENLRQAEQIAAVLAAVQSWGEDGLDRVRAAIGYVAEADPERVRRWYDERTGMTWRV